jgi:cobalt/nickel transport system permease protein
VLPDWLCETAPPRPTKGRASSRFLTRTLRDTARLLETAVFAEQAARARGLLQSLDARAKLICTLALLVAMTFCHHLASLSLIAAFAAGALALSGPAARFAFHRFWWVMPGVFVLVAIPATLNIFVPGDPLVVLWRAHAPHIIGSLRLPSELAITRQGVVSAALLVTRIISGVLLALGLALTTRWQELLKAAHTSVTAPFVFTVAMMYRYLFVLLRTVENMHLARRARTISPAPAAEQRRWVGNRIGVLFSRSRRLSERVCYAMLARGYRGVPRVLAASRLRGRELAWVVACAAVIFVALYLDRFILKGLSW